MDEKLVKRINHLTHRALAGLVWEYFAPIFAISLVCLGLFLAASFSGFWQWLGDPWRLITLVILIGFWAFSIWKAIHAVTQNQSPDRASAQRRIEDDNGFSHRPFEAAQDEMAGLAHLVQKSIALPPVSHLPLARHNADKLQTPIQVQWHQHQSQAQALLQQAKPTKWRAALAPLDPYYLRYLIPCLVLVAAVFGYGNLYERTRSAITPNWQAGINAHDVTYEAWIDPPSYTGRPPRYFKKVSQASAPDGSEFVVRISGIKTAPRLIMRSAFGTKRIAPKRLGPQSFEVRTRLKTKTNKPSTQYTASLNIGRQSKNWILNIGRDAKPTIEIVDPPKANKRDRLVFTYSAMDDFGIVDLQLKIIPKQVENQFELLKIDLPGTSPTEIEQEPASLILTKHKWAGREVSGYLLATDGQGQQAVSKTHDFIIPDKIFVEPLAKAIAEQRQLMMAGTGQYAPMPTSASKAKPIFAHDLSDRALYDVYRPERTLLRAPAPVRRTAELIEIITESPAGIFDDPSVYMGLRHIYRTIKIAREQSDLSGVVEDLWDIAIRAEFGLLGDALLDMQRAETALNNAMARHAPQREIDALFDRYNTAVDRYMEELIKKAIEEAKKQGQKDGQDSGESGPNMQSDEIQELLDAIEEANRLGDTVTARKALAQLAKLLENMKMQIDPSGGGKGDGPADPGMSDELKQALEELNELLGEQRKLRDETQSTAIDEVLKKRDNQGREKGQEKGQPKGDKNGSEQGSNTPPKSAQQLAQDQKELADILKRLEAQKGIQDAIKEGQKENPGGSDKNTQSSDQANGQKNGDTDKIGGGGDIDIEQALDNAKSAMKEAEGALSNDQIFRARREQSKAIDALRKAGKGIYAQESDKRGENKEEAEGADDDPFGRDGKNGSGVGDEVDVNQVNDQQRARDLLQDLRERSGDQNRSETEREYLERLLKRF